MRSENCKQPQVCESQNRETKTERAKLAVDEKGDGENRKIGRRETEMVDEEARQRERVERNGEKTTGRDRGNAQPIAIQKAYNTIKLVTIDT